MSADTRPLHIRVRALAQRYDAMAAGSRKKPGFSTQVAVMQEHDAATLHEAANALETVRKPA